VKIDMTVLTEAGQTLFDVCCIQCWITWIW